MLSRLRHHVAPHHGTVNNNSSTWSKTKPYTDSDLVLRNRPFFRLPSAQVSIHPFIHPLVHQTNQQTDQLKTNQLTYQQNHQHQQYQTKQNPHRTRLATARTLTAIIFNKATLPCT
jgi:hypothetical protein